MYLLGEKQVLTVTRVGEIGCYLGDHYDSRAEDVLLPVPEAPGPWDETGAGFGGAFTVCTGRTALSLRILSSSSHQGQEERELR